MWVPIYRDDVLIDILEEWRVFLAQDLDARLIVKNVMERTGVDENEVFFLLMDVWTEQNSTLEQRRELDAWLRPSIRLN
jgi:TfoX/Sxy family transcriptional regulator of competence genes